MPENSTLTEEEKEELELLTPLDLKTSKEMEKKIKSMIEAGVPENEIRRTIHADMVGLWNNPNEWVEIKALIPRCLVPEQNLIVKKCRRVINALDKMDLSPSVFNELGPSIPESSPDAIVFGHLLIRGGNDILKLYASKVAEKKANMMISELLSGKGGGKNILADYLKMLSNTGQAKNENDEKEHGAEVDPKQEPDITGYQ